MLDRQNNMYVEIKNREHSHSLQDEKAHCFFIYPHQENMI